MSVYANRTIFLGYIILVRGEVVMKNCRDSSSKNMGPFSREKIKIAHLLQKDQHIEAINLCKIDHF